MFLDNVSLRKFYCKLEILLGFIPWLSRNAMAAFYCVQITRLNLNSCPSTVMKLVFVTAWMTQTSFSIDIMFGNCGGEAAPYPCKVKVGTLDKRSVVLCTIVWILIVAGIRLQFLALLCVINWFVCLTSVSIVCRC